MSPQVNLAGVSLWQIIVGVLGGLLVLLLIIVCLVKLGAFKRKAPPEQAQQEDVAFAPEEAQRLQQE